MQLSRFPTFGQESTICRLKSNNPVSIRISCHVKLIALANENKSEITVKSGGIRDFDAFWRTWNALCSTNLSVEDPALLRFLHKERERQHSQFRTE